MDGEATTGDAAGGDLLSRLAAEADLPRIEPDEAEAVLRLARVVAHGAERRLAPLSTYLLGRSLELGLDPEQRRARILALTALVERLADIPEEP